MMNDQSAIKKTARSLREKEATTSLICLNNARALSPIFGKTFFTALRMRSVCA